MLGLAFALAGAPSGTSGGSGGEMAAFQHVIPLIYPFAIFYFLRIRLRKKKALEHRALQGSLKKGDGVITSDGVHGKVSAAENDLVILNVLDHVTIEIIKSSIVSIKKDSVLPESGIK